MEARSGYVVSGSFTVGGSGSVTTVGVGVGILSGLNGFVACAKPGAGGAGGTVGKTRTAGVPGSTPTWPGNPDPNIPVKSASVTVMTVCVGSGPSGNVVVTVGGAGGAGGGVNAFVACAKPGCGGAGGSVLDSEV